MTDMSKPALQSPMLIPFDHLERMAAAVAKSGLFGMKAPEQALALMLISQAEGQHPATITQDYDIIQGKAARKTNSVLARYQAAGGQVEWHELTDKKADATFTPPAKAGKPLRMDWTIEQAKAAGLTGKDNWRNYPRAMLRSRLIAEGVRATFPAAIGGMLVAEEAQDIEHDVTPQQPKEAPALSPYEQATFDKNLPEWKRYVDAGRKTPADIIATISSKHTLTDDQRKVIEALANVKDALATDADVEAMAHAAAEAAVPITDVLKHLGMDDLAGLTVTQLESATAFIQGAK